ncbi:MAG: cysteine hydrolase [Clostridia bacterium]|nr:cysteine hydrolase [Clostridia bacterium]
MSKILLVIDMQKDFIDGALGTLEAVSIVPTVLEKIKNFDGEVVFTKDTHSTIYPMTQEGKKLPVPHCIKGTEGWELDAAIAPMAQGCRIFEKPTFGSIELAEFLAGGDYDEIEIIGLCTDICVISNALLIKAYLPEVKITVDSACCAGVTVESHKNALSAMKMCQIDII